METKRCDGDDARAAARLLDELLAHDRGERKGAEELQLLAVAAQEDGGRLFHRLGGLGCGHGEALGVSHHG